MLANIRTSIPALVHDIARRVRYSFDGRTRNMGVTRPQWRMLITLSRMDGPTQSEVAELLEVERITLCRMVDRLAEAGLVERRADPADRRVWRLYLTEKARPIVDQLTTISEALEHDLLSVLNPSERQMLVELLTRVRDGIRSPYDGDVPVTRGTRAVA